jgi:ABC-type polysaccharide/polyol phosphate export permease
MHPVLLDTTSRAAKRGMSQGERRLNRDGLNRLSGWQVQWRVVDALVYRELRTRVSDVRGGFLGVLIQPLGLIAIWTTFLTAINVQRGGSLNTVLFLATAASMRWMPMKRSCFTNPSSR